MAAPILDDDPFAQTRMPLGEHLEVLRTHLWRALKGFALVAALCLGLDLVGYLTGTPVGVGKPAINLLTRPVEEALGEFYDRRASRLAEKLQAGELADEPKEVELDLDLADLAARLAPLLGVKAPPPGPAAYVRLTARVRPAALSLALEQAQRKLGRRPGLSTLSATEGMMVYFKVALFCCFVLASPWVFWQLWSFVAAGLYPHEKRLVHLGLPFSLGLFLAGVAICQFLAMPRALEGLLWFNEWLELEPDFRLNEWLGFALLLPLVFGLAFQTPLVMLVLERLGVFSAEELRGKRRQAWFGLALVAAVITPSADFYSMAFLWVPLGLLYELGLVLCRLRRPVPALAEDGGAWEV